MFEASILTTKAVEKGRPPIWGKEIQKNYNNNNKNAKMTSHERACSRWVGQVKNPFAPPKTGNSGEKIAFLSSIKPDGSLYLCPMLASPSPTKKGGESILID